MSNLDIVLFFLILPVLFVTGFFQITLLHKEESMAIKMSEEEVFLILRTNYKGFTSLVSKITTRDQMLTVHKHFQEETFQG